MWGYGYTMAGSGGAWLKGSRLLILIVLAKNLGSA
jgi:hypothetical protein